MIWFHVCRAGEKIYDYQPLCDGHDVILRPRAVIGVTNDEQEKLHCFHLNLNDFITTNCLLTSKNDFTGIMLKTIRRPNIN